MLGAGDLMRIIRESKKVDEVKAKEAFGALYYSFKDILWSLCVSVCGDTADADLVYQATWRKIYKNPSYDDTSHDVSFETWMSRIAKNAWLDIRRKQVLIDREPEKGFEIMETDDSFDREEREPTLDEKLLMEALAQLTEKEFDIMRTYIEYDTDAKKHVPDEILKGLQTKYHTTATNLRQIKSRALKKVKSYIENRR